MAVFLSLCPLVVSVTPVVFGDLRSVSRIAGKIVPVMAILGDLGVVFVAIASLPAIWNFADLSMGLMALTNLIDILLLSPVALRIPRDCERQLIEGKTGD